MAQVWLHLENISCKIITSDMCLIDEYGKHTLSGQISIMYEDAIFYTLHITIREGKNNSPVSKKKNDKHKSKKKRR